MILEKLEPGTIDTDLRDLERLRNRPRTIDTKLIKTSNETLTAISVTPYSIDLSAGSSASGDPVGVSVVASTGTVIRGPLGLSGTPGDVRVAGLWKFNDLLLSGMPSTMMSPIPVMVFSPPLESAARFAKSAAVLVSLMVIL